MYFKISLLLHNNRKNNMEILYAPWREEYASRIGKDAQGKESTPSEECIFCHIIQSNKDEEFLVLKRYASCYVMLNKYPYNAGHLLIVAHEHHKALTDFTQEQRYEMLDVITQTTTILAQVVEYDGVNIGLNTGKAAGAGIPSHLHWHVLPRWFGDTNFLPTLAGTKTISTDLSVLYKTLQPYFNSK